MNKDFQLSKNKIVDYKPSQPLNSFQAYTKRFFSKKINIIVFTLLVSVLLALTLTLIFYSYSPNKAILDSYLAYNLPNYFSGDVEIRLNHDDEFLKLLHSFNNSQLILKELQIGDQINVVYNPYVLLELINNQKPILLFGTNDLGIDKFAYFIYSLGLTLLISIIAIFLQLFIGSILGAHIGYYAKKPIAKFNYYLISMFNIIPFLIFTLILFKISSYSIINAILILGFLGSISFFLNTYSETIELKKQEFIIANISVGMSNNRIIWKVIIIQSFFKNLSFIGENIALNILALATLAFFNIKNINTSLNIGAVFKDIINDLHNVSYSIFVILSTSFISILFKTMGVISYLASNPLLERGNDV